jgi:serine/threonine-protein kinase HipA
VDSDGIPVTLVRRFDRKGDLRIPFISAMTLLGVEEGDPQPHTYTEIVDALRVHGADLVNDLEELWRRIAFSILSTNLDDHLRNHGFLYHGAGRWCLSPAFDINPFPDRVRELKTWISEETGPAAMLDPLMATATYFQIKAKRAREILAEVEGAVSKWRVRGREIGMSAVELDQFAEAFEHEERRVARQFVAPACPS